MTPPARPGMPAPRGGPARPAPPRPVPPRPRRPPSGAVPQATPADTPADVDREPADAPGAARSPQTSSSGGAALAVPRDTDPREVVPASATSDAVTTYTARRRALGIPVRPGVVSSGSAARFAERVAMRRRLARHKAYVAAAVAVLLGALGWLLLLSPVLALDARTVQVTGAGTVVDVADVHAVVAEVDGVPLPRLDTVGLRDRVLDVPGVRHAKISRLWPHGLVVSLVSREPVAAVPQRAPSGGSSGLSSGPSSSTSSSASSSASSSTSSSTDGPSRPGFALLDVEGFSVGWTATPPEGLPVVDVPVVREGRNHSLDAVLAILEALPPELAGEVATIEARTRDTVRMGLRDGKTVVWGSAGDAPLKIRVLQALRAAPAAAGANEYDVSAPTLPITR